MRLNQMQNILKQGNIANTDKLHQKMGLEVSEDSKKHFHQELFGRLRDKLSMKENEYREKQSIAEREKFRSLVEQKMQASSNRDLNDKSSPSGKEANAKQVGLQDAYKHLAMPIKSKQGKGDSNIEEEKKSVLEPKYDKQSKGEVLETLSDCSAEVPSEGAAETSFEEGKKK